MGDHEEMGTTKFSSLMISINDQVYGRASTNLGSQQERQWHKTFHLSTLFIHCVSHVIQVLKGGGHGLTDLRQHMEDLF